MSNFEFRHAVSNQGNRDILIFEIFDKVGFYFEQNTGQIFLINGQEKDSVSILYEGVIYTPPLCDISKIPCDLLNAPPGDGSSVLLPNMKGYFSPNRLSYTNECDIKNDSCFVQMNDIEIRTASHPDTFFAINGFNRYQGDHNVILWVADIIKVIACEKP